MKEQIVEYYHLGIYLPDYLFPFFGEIEYGVILDKRFYCLGCGDNSMARLRIHNPEKYMRPPLGPYWSPSMGRDNNFNDIYFCGECHHLKQIRYPLERYNFSKK